MIYTLLGIFYDGCTCFQYACRHSGKFKISALKTDAAY
jgi:hypothetical protein